jgi:hypothetical protein
MTLRSYFRSFFTREYWEAFGDFLFGIAFARHTIREEFWERVEREAEADKPVEKSE